MSAVDRQSDENGDQRKRIPIGDVGFRFRKYFRGHGVFEGRVVEIGPEANGDRSMRNRRCRYEDGDSEDLSKRQLLYWASKYPMGDANCLEGGSSAVGSSGNENIAEPDSKKRKILDNVDSGRQRTKKNSNTRRGSVAKRRNENQDNQNPRIDCHDPFADVEDHLPVDRAAETTLERSRPVSRADMITKSDGEEEEAKAGEWLHRVASMLGASESHSSIGVAGFAGNARYSFGRSRVTSPSPSLRDKHSPPSRLNSLPDSSLELELIAEGVSVRNGLPSKPLPSPEEGPSHPRVASPSLSSTPSKDLLFSLLDINFGRRYGSKVFRKEDNERLVGEVLLENPNGYVEVIIGHETKQIRVRDLIVAPGGYHVGSKVPPHFVIPEIRGKGGKRNRPSLIRTKDSASRCRSSPSGRGNEVDVKLCPQISTKGFLGTDKENLSFSQHQSVRKESVYLTDLFYWLCAACSFDNSFTKVLCTACGLSKGEQTKLSPLLGVAYVAAMSADTAEEAHEQIPLPDRDAVPKHILDTLISQRREKDNGFEHLYSPTPIDLDSFFCWSCNSCTLTNSFRRSSCLGCKKSKGGDDPMSLVLRIASEAAYRARTVTDALRAVPKEHRKSIPETVLASLVTCIAISSRRKNGRCRRVKAAGSDFCSIHCNDPLQLSAGTICTLAEAGSVHVQRQAALSIESESPSPRRKRNLHNSKDKNLASISSKLTEFFACHGASLENNLNWNIRSMEDAILCQETGPFPLGLLVRRFFKHYGFHDGRIIEVLRRNVLDSDGAVRPVLLYRVCYNDGDFEDFMHHEISSLRQIYDRCNIKRGAPPSSQIAYNSFYETRNGFATVIGHSTPKDVFLRDEGGVLHLKYCTEVGLPWSIAQSDLKKFQTSVVRMLLPTESIGVGPANSSSLVDDEELLESDEALRMNGSEVLSPVKASNTSLRSIGAAPRYPAPLLEWPIVDSRKSKAEDKKGGEMNGSFEEVRISEDLFLTKTAIQSVEAGDKDDKDWKVYEEGPTSVVDDLSCVRNCLGRPSTGWDPAGAFSYVQWDPFRDTVCSICHQDKDEHLILICDGCHAGYHMYCLRPVLVNVPTTDWFCSLCKSGRKGSPKNFSEYIADLNQDPKDALGYLKLPYSDASQFLATNRKGLEAFGPGTNMNQRKEMVGNFKKTPTIQVGVRSRRYYRICCAIVLQFPQFVLTFSFFSLFSPSGIFQSLFFSWAIRKSDLLIPIPTSNSNDYRRCLASYVASMRYAGMLTYSEDLTYPSDGHVTEEMNDASLDDVETLSLRNLDIFRRFKENIKNGAVRNNILSHFTCA